MFMGEYNHTIDAKGRLIVPAKFREILGDNFIVTKGLDGCLFVYPNDEWTRFEEKLKSLPLTNKNARQFTRFFLAGATGQLYVNNHRKNLSDKYTNHVQKEQLWEITERALASWLK